MVKREQYERLARRLQQDGRPRIEMTFTEVSRIIGEPLPASASEHPAWWGTDPKHTQATWSDVGYTARPNLAAGRVVFERSALCPRTRVTTGKAASPTDRAAAGGMPPTRAGGSTTGRRRSSRRAHRGHRGGRGGAHEQGPARQAETMINMVESPPLVLAHPRHPGITLHRSPRPGRHLMLAVGVELDGKALVDVGDWLAARGREELTRTER